jgi:hypothetical protein
MSKPPQLVPLRCSASGENFYSYSTASRGVGFKAPCPVCGLPVQLMRKRGSTVKFNHIIPTHNKAQDENS